MDSRRVNDLERFILEHCQPLMTPEERMVARALVAAEFDVERIPRSVERRTWQAFPGATGGAQWKLPIEIALRVLRDNRGTLTLPPSLRSAARGGGEP